MKPIPLISASPAERPRHPRAPYIVLCAALLPIALSFISTHFAAFTRIPFSLNFLFVCILAAAYGFRLSILAVVVSIASYAFFLPYKTPPAHFSRADFPRTIVLLIGCILLSIVQDRRRRAQDRHILALDTLEDRTSALIETLHASKCASWRLDLDAGLAARWYLGSYPVFGRPFTDLETIPALLPFIHPEDQTRLPTLVQTLQTTTAPLLFEYRVLWPDGDLHWIEMSATRVPGPANVWRGIAVDITDRKQTEASLIRSEKLAAMGRLASTVAHEINNPLESVTNLLYLAHSDPTLAPATKNYLAIAEQELARLGDITRLTLGFVRNSGSRRDLDVAQVIDEVLSIFRHRLESKSIQIQRDFQSGVRIHIAAHELRQIFTNLISNAADAALSPSTAEPSLIRIRIAADSSGAHIILEDNGSGIPPAVLPRIFDPFFTTKQDIGTGIGLWVTRELIETNGGHITVESGNLGAGIKTRFRIDFVAVAATLSLP